jgi:hypothetical protein
MKIVVLTFVRLEHDPSRQIVAPSSFGYCFVGRHCLAGKYEDGVDMNVDDLSPETFWESRRLTRGMRALADIHVIHPHFHEGDRYICDLNIQDNNIAHEPSD